MPLPLEWFADMEPQLSGMWLIKRLLPASGLALIYGHPGSGKSFLALDLAFHIALGWAWNGRAVKQGLVVYVGAEGGSGLRNRMVAFRRHHGLDGGHVPLALIPTPIDLQDPAADTPRLIAAIRLAEEAAGQPAVLIVIDTLSKTFGAGKENTDDMATYVSNCGRVSAEFSACVMPVHHRPKDSENETPRGHGSLAGGVDTIILVEAGATKRIRCTKQKDGEMAGDMGFSLQSIVLGEDEDGEPVTSCVVTLTEGAPPIVRGGRKLTDGQSLCLAALRRAVEESGVDAPANIPLEMLKAGLVVRVATLDAWRNQSAKSSDRSDQSADTARRMFTKQRDRLQALGVVQVWEGFAWITL